MKILLLILLLSFSSFAQTTVSDAVIPEDVDLLITGSFPERSVTGKVVGVHDGDTATVLDNDKRQYKFRFNGIDAPELKQDFGNKSKENLSDLIFGKTVTVKYGKIDKYGRFVGTIYVGGVNANLEQIKGGFAWHYKKYSDEQTADERTIYSDSEVKARNAKLGLWLQPNPTAPWDYRTVKKETQAVEKANRKYQTGARGGCFYINSSGNKTYVKKSFCGGN